jgi:hypothetical protein
MEHEIHHGILKSLPPVPIQSQINPVNAPIQIYFNIHSLPSGI